MLFPIVSLKIWIELLFVLPLARDFNTNGPAAENNSLLLVKLDVYPICFIPDRNCEKSIKPSESFLKEININNSIEDKILKETLKRVAKSWMEMLDGYNIDDKTLYKTFPAANNNLVVVRDIEFASVCEHHLLPFTGLMAIGYIPNDRVLGLSKFARIVNCFARRLQLQEKLVIDIANSILSNLNTEDLFIVAKAVHSCISCREVNQRNLSTLTFFSNEKFRNYRESELLILLNDKI